MPVYEYKAVDTHNKARKGMVDADSPREARLKLRSENSLFVTDIQEARQRGRRKIAIKGVTGVDAPDRRRNEQVAAVTRQMASLLGAGIPLAEAMRMVIEQAPDKKMEATFREIREKVTQGMSFGDAVALYPAYFTDLYANMVRAGENAGALDQVMLRLSNFLQAQARLKNKVAAAMIYPTIMIVIGIVVVSILMVFVVPKITQLLRSKGEELPLATKILIGVSEFAQNYWLLVMLGLLLLTIAFQLFVNSTRGGLIWDKFKLGIPVFGDLLRKQSMARFATTFSTLLKSGVPALQAINVTKSVLDNRVLTNALTDVHDRILEGADISTPMKLSGQFPPMVAYMVGVGEQAGNLEEMLERVADSYEEEVDLATQKLTSMLEPMIIVCLATIVAGIVIAIVLPLLQMQKF
ncbi:MAG: type II secretion system F family protein [Planctomycetota bacterium]|jgi:general secretion pathway protein F